jgi:hypothetical protein
VLMYNTYFLQILYPKDYFIFFYTSGVVRKKQPDCSIEHLKYNPIG